MKLNSSALNKVALNSRSGAVSVSVMLSYRVDNSAAGALRASVVSVQQSVGVDVLGSATGVRGAVTALTNVHSVSATPSYRASAVAQLVAGNTISGAAGAKYSAASTQVPPAVSLDPHPTIVRWECSLRFSLSQSFSASVRLGNTCVLGLAAWLGLAPGARRSGLFASRLGAQVYCGGALCAAGAWGSRLVVRESFVALRRYSVSMSSTMNLREQFAPTYRSLLHAWRDGRAYRVVRDTNIGGLLEGGMVRDDITRGLGTVGM